MKIEKRVKTQDCENCGKVPKDTLCFLVSYGCVYCDDCCEAEGVSRKTIEKFSKEPISDD